MTPDRYEFDPAEWAALYAAGALTLDECAAFESRLAAGDAACVAELRDLEPVIDLLLEGIEPVAPATDVRARLMARIENDAVPTEAPAPRPRREHLIQFASKARWRDSGIPGVQRRVLSIDRERNQFTVLLRCEPGATFPEHRHSGPEECLILEGDLWVGDVELGPGDYQRLDAGSVHVAQTTRRGCLLLLIGALETGMT